MELSDLPPCLEVSVRKIILPDIRTDTKQLITEICVTKKVSRQKLNSGASDFGCSSSMIIRYLCPQKNGRTTEFVSNGMKGI